MNTPSYAPVGYMPMPAGFPFKDLFYKGRPRHDRNDAFRIRHPEMNHTHRAKIFAPFDALAGFSEAIASKEVLYEPKRQLSETEKAMLDARLQKLQPRACDGPAARKNLPQAVITYFVPCSDKDSFAYGLEGTYNTVSGNVEKTDTYTITIDGLCIPLEDVADIR